MSDIPPIHCYEAVAKAIKIAADKIGDTKILNSTCWIFAEAAIAAMGEWHSADSNLKGTVKSLPCESESPAIIYTWRHGDDEPINGMFLECDDPANPGIKYLRATIESVHTQSDTGYQQHAQKAESDDRKVICVTGRRDDQPCEIPVNHQQSRSSSTCWKWCDACGQHGPVQSQQRATMPVSVSLREITEKVSSVAIDDDQQFIKAVLDAAGVKYGD